jgi:cell division protein FtsA
MIAALDIGSSKVCCVIARVDDANTIRVAGVGHQSSQGVRAGTIINMDDAEAAIANAVHTAEQAAGVTIRDVVVNISGGRPTSHMASVEVAVLDQEVTEVDLRRAMVQSRTQYRINDADVIHAIPIGYSLDGNRGIRDPRGMFGDRLGVQVHLITADGGPIRNLRTCVARCHLDVDSLVVSPYASGLSCLVEDELDLGVTCIDMGGGTTTIAVFAEGNLIYADSIPVGGNHVTSDIARGLTTPLSHAERMKILYGHAMPSSTDEREMVDVPLVGEDERGQGNQVPKSLLVGIIQPRLEEIFELVRSRIEHSGIAKQAGRRVVLTGGACQMHGTRDLAQLILDKQVRVGRPGRVKGLTDVTSGPAFASVCGLLLQASRQPAELPVSSPAMVAPSNIWGRVSGWLRENL